MEYIDPITNERYVPYVIEPSLGADRVALAFLCNAYEEQELEGGDSRVVLHLHPALAPYKAAVLPLQKNKLGDLATEVFDKLSKKFMYWYPFALITPALCVGIAFLLHKADKARKVFIPLRVIGQASFEIYLFNIWMVELVKKWNGKGTLLWLALCVGNILLGIGYHWLVEIGVRRLKRKPTENTKEIQP